MRHEGALLVLFDKPLGEAGHRLMADLQKTALRVDQFEGLTIVEFRDKLEDDTWASYIAIPRADVLVIATDRVFLEESLRRRKARIGSRAFPKDLVEWAWVDASAPFWALRHYRRDAPDDPTSPFGRNNAADAFDAAAVGVTAHVKADGRTVEAHYLSHATAAEQIAKRIWSHPGDGVSPALRRVGPDVIEVRFVAKNEEHLSMFFLSYGSAGARHIPLAARGETSTMGRGAPMQTHAPTAPSRYCAASTRYTYIVSTRRPG
jgi:hypothetical protein